MADHRHWGIVDLKECSIAHYFCPNNRDLSIPSFLPTVFPLLLMLRLLDSLPLSGTPSYLHLSVLAWFPPFFFFFLDLKAHFKIVTVFDRVITKPGLVVHAW